MGPYDRKKVDWVYHLLERNIRGYPQKIQSAATTGDLFWVKNRSTNAFVTKVHMNDDFSDGFVRFPNSVS